MRLHSLKKLWMASRRQSHLLWNLLILILSGIGAIASLGGFGITPRFWLVIATWLILALAIVWSAIKIRRIALISEVWPNWQGARKWMEARLGDPETLKKDGIDTIKFTGVSCTDIAFLFEVLVKAMQGGITFEIYMVNPGSTELDFVKELEPETEVVTVQKALADKLMSLAKAYMGKDATRADQLQESAKCLDSDGRKYKDHAQCIKVCMKLWEIAKTEATRRDGKVDGSYQIHPNNELPFARQWILGNRELLYSTYVGHPGVGADNPVYLYAAGAGDVLKRANHYADRLMKKVPEKPSQGQGRKERESESGPEQS